MANKTILKSQTFGKGDEKTFGYTFEDEYASCFNDFFEAPIEDDLELLKEIVENYMDEVETDLINNLIENELGIEINGTWYDYEEIAEIIGE